MRKQTSNIAITYSHISEGTTAINIATSLFYKTRDVLLQSRTNKKVRQVTASVELYKKSQGRHIHVLIELDGIVNFFNFENIINAFTVNNVEPYIALKSNSGISICYPKGYMKYIKKSIKIDPTYINDSSIFFIYKSENILHTVNENGNDLDIKKDIDTILLDLDSLNRNNLRKVLKKYPIDKLLSYKTEIDFLYSKLPEGQNNDYLRFILNAIGYKYESYGHNCIMILILETIFEHINTRPHKYSLVFIGDSNNGKTEAIKAILKEIESMLSKNNIDCLVLRTDKIENLKGINTEKRLVLIFLDDPIINIKEEDKNTKILQGGGSGSVTIESRYEDVITDENDIKFIAVNSCPSHWFRNIESKHLNRFKTYVLNEKIYEYNHMSDYKAYWHRDNSFQAETYRYRVEEI